MSTVIHEVNFAGGGWTGLYLDGRLIYEGRDGLGQPGHAVVDVSDVEVVNVCLFVPSELGHCPKTLSDLAAELDERGVDHEIPEAL